MEMMNSCSVIIPFKYLVFVAYGFKNKTRYTPYVSPGSQISHIATNKGNIKRQVRERNLEHHKNSPML